MDGVKSGVIKQAAVTRVESGKVELEGGEELTADFIVMATGGKLACFFDENCSVSSTKIAVFLRRKLQCFFNEYCSVSLDFRAFLSGSFPYA